MTADRTLRISVAEALALIEASVSPLGSEMVPVAAAAGRVTAAPVRALANTPRYRASAMDGYAVRSIEVASAKSSQPVWLPLGALIAAGTWPNPLMPGEAVPIATGAPLPDGADAVVLWEDATVSDGRVAICRPVQAGRNVRAVGEDCAVGAVVMPADASIAPDAVGVLAAFGIHEVCVRRQPRIGLLATGSELRAGIGLVTRAGLVDSNSPMIAACANAAGLTCKSIGVAADNPAAIDAALATGMTPDAGDIILSTGGVSVGGFDLVRSRLEAQSCRILFHGVAMRPGKPLLFALLPDGRPFFGLPGTPLAALVGFRFFVGAAIRRMLALPPEAGMPVNNDYPARAGASLFLRGRRGWDRNSQLVVDTALDQRPHILRSLLDSDSWVRIDPATSEPPVCLCYPKELLLR